MSLPLAISPGDVGHIVDHEEIGRILDPISDLTAFKAAGHKADTFANRPAASAATNGMLFYATDTQALYLGEGGAWTTVLQSHGSHTWTGIQNFDEDVFFGSGRPWIDVMNVQYGAVGDGVTDDTAAIQAAIDALAGSGGIIQFGPGVFAVSATLTFNTAKTFIFQGAGQAASQPPGGTQIKWTGGASPIITVSSPVKNFTVRDMEFNNTGTATIAINIPGGSVYDFRIERVSVLPTVDFSTSQIDLGSNALVLAATFSDVMLRCADHTGGFTTLRANEINGLWAYNLRSINGIVKIGSGSQSVVNASFHGGSFESGQAINAVTINRAVDVSFHGCYWECDGAAYMLEVVTLGRAINIYGGFCSSGNHSTGSTYAVRMNDSTGIIKIDGMEFQSFANPAYIVRRTAARRVVIKDCTMNSTGMTEIDTTTNDNDIILGNATIAASRPDRLPSGIAIGPAAAQSGHLRMPHGKGVYWRDSGGGNDRSLMGFGELVNDEFYLGNPNNFTHLRTNLAAASSPSNGDWWVEATGTSPARVAAIKVRDGGVTRTIASVTY